MLQRARNIKNLVTRLVRDESGGMVTLTAIMLPMIFGFAGLGLDATSWYMERRSLQNMADMGSLEGAHTSDTYTGDDLIVLVKQFLATEGYDAETDTITVSHPPVTGDYIGDMGFVEVHASRIVNMYMLSGFYALRGERSSITVAARAVAGDVVTGEQCIVSLDESADQALYFSGTADVDAACGVASNSTSSTAIYVQGNATLTADPAQAVGDIYLSSDDSLITTSPIQTYAPKVEDPYEDKVVFNDWPACSSGEPEVFEGGGSPNDITNFASPGEVDGSLTDETGLEYYIFSPGRYCGGLKVQSNTKHAFFLPGSYVLDGGDFSVSAQSIMTGDGVTFFFTADIAEDIGSINKVNGGATLKLSAPAEGVYQGLLFFQDDRAPPYAATASFNGGSSMKMDGALYFPNNEINFTGGSSSDPTCLQIIGGKVSFTGSSVIGNDASICTTLGLKGLFNKIRVELVE